MKQAIEKDINKINTLEDTDLEYHREIVNYLKEYDRFIYKVALSVKNKCRRLEIEDIKQQLILVILSNGNKYDKLKSENHSSYFSQIAIHAASNIVKRYWQDKNKINVTYVSLDAFIDEDLHNYQFIDLFKEDDDSLLYPENIYNINEFTRKINDADTYLSVFERKVFMMYLQGKDIKQISAKLRKSKKTIYNALAIIREKIKEKM